jgi:hypothetical protein
VLAAGRQDRQRRTRGPAVTEIEAVLVGMQPLPGDRLQHFHIFSSVSRPDVLDLARPFREECTICTAIALLAVVTVRI